MCAEVLGRIPGLTHDEQGFSGNNAGHIQTPPRSRVLAFMASKVSIHEQQSCARRIAEQVEVVAIGNDEKFQRQIQTNRDTAVLTHMFSHKTATTDTKLTTADLMQKLRLSRKTICTSVRGIESGIADQTGKGAIK